MKISAFQIRNYRSIINSGKCYLSPDSITALIGQNESGKTSVLEALKSFYDGQITDDILRSDMTFPEITCSFILDEDKELGEYIDMMHIPEELHTVVSTKSEFSLTRKWSDSKTNTISLAEPEIIDYYNEQKNNALLTSNKINTLIPVLVQDVENATRDLQFTEKKTDQLRSEANMLHSRVEELKRHISKAKNPDDRISNEQEFEKAQNDLLTAENNFRESLKELEERKINLQTSADKLTNCKSFLSLSDTVNVLQKEIEAHVVLIHQTEHEHETCKNDRQIRSLSKQLEQMRSRQEYLMNESKRLSHHLSIQLRIAEKMVAGTLFKEAEAESIKEQERESAYATLEELGNSVFKHIPMFEFFEDFGSLLPNKIDLDDLLNENIHAEGYKAARNFLSIAGLNADFFREKNHRILKQKIENLNSEITIDFQDYWRQSVGKDDKIRINFELEHYDNSQPDKSGKPYLEFWIKDKQERLYPKQRSRGVRWFLSFYLELKATAKEKSEDRVMLIDEPGLSLHARAQEDVLKVFEDLRQNLQIIYCTHSPNLIDSKKLYRIIAVQRERDTDEKSETIILDARRLNAASADTLSPIYALMGTQLNERQFIFPKDNLIVEDSVTFHYLEAFCKLIHPEQNFHFIPASGNDSVPIMANLFFGWKIEFRILLMDNSHNRALIEHLRSSMFFPEDRTAESRVQIMPDFPAIEDLFSTIDFKRFVLQQRVGITMRNSEYIEMNKLSRMILASDFCTKLQKEEIRFSDFDEETRENLSKFFTLIQKNS